MTQRDAPLRFLSHRAARSAAEWKTLGETAFAGDLSIATDNSIYAFHNGVLVSRAKKPTRFLEAPKGMRGLLLVGFLEEDHESDRWVLSVEWQPGAHAVLWRSGSLDASSFILTSPTASFSLAELDPKPNPWIRGSPSHSGVVTMPRRNARPPSLRMPLPPSMTRLHPASSVPSDR